MLRVSDAPGIDSLARYARLPKLRARSRDAPPTAHGVLLGCLIGEGGYANVFRHFDAESGAPVAIKRSRLGKPYLGLPALSVREASALAELAASGDDSAVVHLSDAFVAKGRLHLVLEDADADLGVVLERLLVARAPAAAFPLGGIGAGFVASRFLRALGALHAAGWVHCDVKPANVLLLPRAGAIRICDLGFVERKETDALSSDALQSVAVKVWGSSAAASAGADVDAAPHTSEAAAKGGDGDADADEAADHWMDVPLSRWDGAQFPQIASVPFRAPELLMCSRAHDAAVDAWAAGATVAEIARVSVSLFLGRDSVGAVTFPLRPLFGGYNSSELEVLAGASAILGPPCARVWPGARVLPGFMGSSARCGACDPGAASGAASHGWTPPSWARAHTLQDSCAGAKRDGSGSSSPPIFHACALAALASWLCGGAPVPDPLPAELAAFPDFIDLVLRLCAWDPLRRARLADVTAHAALAGVPAFGSNDDAMLIRALCRVHARPRASAGAPPSSSPYDENDGRGYVDECGVRAIDLFGGGGGGGGGGLLMFNGDD